MVEDSRIEEKYGPVEDARSPVENDYEQARSFDVTKQSRKRSLKSILLVFVLVGTLVGYTYIKLRAMGGTIFELLIAELVISMIVMPPIIWYYQGRTTTLMNMAHQGYQVDWDLDRKHWFGRDTYEILRADPGRLGGAIIGHNMNPFAVSKRQLKDLQEKQREDAICEVCGTEAFDKRALDRDGGYFVEERRRLWILGVPIAERVLGWEFYCPQHKPKKFES